MAETAKPRSGARWMRIALVISLAANLAVAGLLVGVALDRRGDIRAGHMQDLAISPFSEAMTAGDRQAMRRGFVERLGDEPLAAARAAREARHAAHAALIESLRAEPFEPARVAAILEAEHLRVRDRLRMGEELLIERFAAMSPAERAAYADRFEAALMRVGPAERFRRRN